MLHKTRRVIGDAAILAVFNSPPAYWQITAFHMDWQAPNADALLDPAEDRTTMAYDALNRATVITYPQDASGARKQLRPHYNRAGALARVELDGAPYVARIAYTAKGQRALIAYGNGLMTRYAYDPRTFHLLRLRTERFSTLDGLTYRPSGAPLQDFAYAYDLAGNILAIHDRAPGSGVPNILAGLDALDRVFGYDPLYRLLSATGREHAIPPPDVPWLDAVRSQDPTLTRAYAEQYHYDAAGNLARLRHQAGDGSFTRDFALAPGSNRLASMTVGATPYAYAYDPNGNLLREGTGRHFEWDHADRLRVFRTQPAGAEPSVYATFLYDADGQRVVKLVRRQGGAYEVTIYVDGIFEHHRRVQGGATQENNTLHIMDNQARIALLRVGAPLPGDAGPALQYHLGDHLGSSNVVIDADGAWVNREEHTPYGETSFGGFAKKRYRFTGKQRDEESGLSYHGARYYAPWLGRWASCDPKGMVDGPNLYAYARGAVIVRKDPDGTQSVSDSQSQGDRNTQANWKQPLFNIDVSKVDTTLSQFSQKLAAGRSHFSFEEATTSIQVPSTKLGDLQSIVTAAQLRTIAPNLNQTKAENILPYLNLAMKEFNIRTPERQAMFIAQLAHESGGFQFFKELGDAQYFKRYANRPDIMGSSPAGTIPQFIGRGVIQVTGRANYAAASKALGVDFLAHPELLEKPEYAFRAAGWFWKSHNLNNLADRGSAGLEDVTRRINGGLIGLADRRQYFQRAQQAFDIGQPK